MAAVAGIVGGIGGLVSAGSGIANAFGGGNNSSAWSPSRDTMNATGNNFLGGAYGIQPYALNYAQQGLSGVTNATQAAANNPYGGLALQGANTASNYGTGTLAPQQVSGAAALNGLGGQFMPYVGQALTAGFDPRNALYARQYQQMLDQTNVINSQNGVAGSPYAAGLATQASQNFNLDWLDRALGRQATAANTASTLGGASTAAYNAGNSLGKDAFNTYNTAGALPAQTYQGLAGNALNAYTQGGAAAGNVLGPLQTYLGDLSTYLGLGQVGQQVNYNQNQTSGSNLGQALSALGGSGTGSLSDLGDSLKKLFG